MQLKLLPIREYVGVDKDDPIRFYNTPIVGRLYRRRVEMCLEQCIPGDKVLEVGFGSGVTFPNLAGMYKEVHGLDLTADVKKVSEFWAGRGIPVSLTRGSVLKMPYPNNTFDTVLLISILEHLRPGQQSEAFDEMYRVLKPGGQVVYGVPVERGLMVFMFRMLGTDIRRAHFSTHRDVSRLADDALHKVSLTELRVPLFGSLYEVGHFRRD